jgi:hypothetical protein
VISHGRETLRRRRARGTVLVSVMMLLGFATLMVAAVVVAGSRDATQTVDRTASVRADYNAESAANMALRELVLNTDVDGDGAVGTVAPVTIGSAAQGTFSTSRTVAGSTTTVDVVGLATGTGGAGTQSRRTTRLAVTRTSATARAGLFAQFWEGVATYPVSAFNFTTTPTRVGIAPNLDAPNGGAGSNRLYRGQTSTVTGRWTGHVTLATGGAWQFHADADDDVQMLVNGVSVFSRGGAGGCSRLNGNITLSAGTYSFELRWNDQGGSQCLTAYWTPPGGSISVIPPSAFTHTPTGPFPGIVVQDTAFFYGSGGPGLRVEGYDGSGGPWPGASTAGAARVATNSSAGGKIAVTDGAVVDGNVFSPPGSTPTSVINISGGGSISGSRQAATTRFAVPRVMLPANFSASSLGSFSQWSGTVNLPASDRRYDSFTVGNSVVINVASSTRVFVNGDVNFYDTTQLNISSGATLHLFVGGSMNVHESARINTSNDPGRLRLHLTSTSGGTLTVTDSARLHGHVTNAFGEFSLYNNGHPNTEFIGTFMGERFVTSTSTRVRLDVGGSGGGGGGGGGGTNVSLWARP